MSLMLMAAMSGRNPDVYVPTERSKILTASEPWKAPAGVSKLTRAIGHGARGADATPGTRQPHYTLRTYNQIVHADGTTGGGTLGNYGPYDGDAPGDYCDPWEQSGTGDGSLARICYDYTDTSTYVGGSAATKGQSASGFGKVFIGSTGNTAPADSTYTDVPITAGASYAVTVPAGGSITITWLE